MNLEEQIEEARKALENIKYYTFSMNLEEQIEEARKALENIKYYTFSSCYGVDLESMYIDRKNTLDSLVSQLEKKSSIDRRILLMV